MKKTILIFLFLFVFTARSYSLPIEEDAVFVRIIDTGPGLACVIRMPGDHYMIYDAGHWAGGGMPTFEKIKEIIPEGKKIKLMVLSHSDADHLSAVDEIFDEYRVEKVIRSGLKRTTASWKNADSAIRDAHKDKKTLDINLKFFEFPPGATYRFGDTFVTMVAGFHKPPKEWGHLSQSEKRNAGSIVIRVQFKEKSILFTGDAVGRHIDDPKNALIASEKYMIENSSVIPIDSDVLIAPHHGADNGSSTDFINAVSPEFVIFSAGHAHKHPRKKVVKRYTDNGIKVENMFRTDLGDDEGEKEWKSGRIVGNSDKVGDDDIDILIRPNGEVKVDYANH
jgi:beta-lactamase superfamily II metal-dependent hydrolase